MLVRVAVALLLVTLVPSVACAEKRVALVIGNGAYAKVGKLTNPTRDADAIEALFRKAGFDAVEAKRDLGLAAMRRALRDFSDRVRDADIAAVFFAGHGIEVNGTNYLIPVDATLERDTDVEDETISLERVTQMLEQAKRLRLVVLDACRDNPFVRSMKRTVTSRSIGRGLAEVRVLTSDTLIAFAAKAGSTAADGEGTNSPYTTALVQHVTTPGLDLRLALGRVRDEVLKSTANRQEPHYYGSLGGAEIALVAAKPQALAAPEPKVPPVSEAAREWSFVDKTSVAELETFVRRHPTSAEADYARARIEALKKRQQVAVATPPAAKPVTPQPAQPAVGVAPTPPSAICDGAAVLVGNERRCLKAMDSFKDCPDCPEMVVVPSGSFMMGSNSYDGEKPVHKVTIAKPFALGKFAVTFAEWDACVSAGGCKHKPEDQGWGRGTRPVINVSWDDAAKEYLPSLSRKTGKTYRLLTEAEWEYTARGVTTASAVHTKYYWGNDIGQNLANCDGCGSQYYKQTAPVGSFKPTAFGLYDMYGNVWQWVQDCWHGSYQGAPTDGSAWVTSCTEGSRRVLRGGSWNSYPQNLRAAHRNGNTTDDRYYYSGFRVARTLSP